MGKRKSVRTIITVFLIIIILFFASNFMLRFILRTSCPLSVVVSGSMYPTLKVGDLLVVEGVNPEELEIGDIIVFHNPVNPGELIVHRIIEIVRGEDGLLYFGTKGDANSLPDKYRWGKMVSEELIEGKVLFVIPSIGWLRIILDPLLTPPVLYVILGFLIFITVILTIKESYSPESFK